MIAIDTSSLIAFLQGERGDDTTLIDAALGDRVAVLPPVVLSEILSDPALDQAVALTIVQLPALSVIDGFWERAGRLRAKVLGSGARARLADTLIAQSCLDHRVPLVTRDRDFRHFQKRAKLRLLP